MQKSTKMTVLPIRTLTMTSPTVTSVNNKETKTSRISNFSVASLLADTRRSHSPPPVTPAAVIRAAIISENHLHHNNHIADISLVPKNLSIHNNNNSNKNSSCSPNSPHNNNNNDSSNNSIKLNDSELLESSQRSHTPHSSIASEEYDDSMRDEDDEEDSIVDIEDVRNENSTNDEKLKHSSGLQGPPSLVPGQPPIRPTPFSALAAAAAAWSMNNGGVPGWPGARQMPPFGAPGLFPGQGFPGQHNGGVYHGD
jgi:homeobox protein MSX